MKTIIKYLGILAVLSTLLFTASCNNDDDDSSATDLMLEINHKVGDLDLTPNQVQTYNQDVYKFDLVRYYISKIKLYNDVGELIATYPEKYMLVKGEEASSFNIGEIEPGLHVHRIVFNVGIDPLTNNQSEEDFTSYPDSDPRAVQNPSMHWSWNSGYIFVKLEGEVNGNNVLLHLGTDNLLREVDIMVHENVVPGEMFHIALDADLSMFFDGLDKSSEINTQTMDNMPLAKQVMDNVSLVFSKSEGHNGHGKK